jgi:hypothetical protein
VRLEVPWRELGRVPARRLRLALRALPEAAWDETPLRQRRFRVHAQTRSVLLLWADHSAWPEVTVAAGPRYPELKDALAPVAAAAVERVGGWIPAGRSRRTSTPRPSSPRPTGCMCRWPWRRACASTSTASCSL